MESGQTEITRKECRDCVEILGRARAVPCEGYPLTYHSSLSRGLCGSPATRRRWYMPGHPRSAAILHKGCVSDQPMRKRLRPNSTINVSQSCLQSHEHEGNEAREILYRSPPRHRRSKHMADRMFSSPNMGEQDPLLFELEHLRSIPSNIRHISSSLNPKHDEDLPEQQ